jgi:hypothetical protein
MRRLFFSSSSASPATHVLAATVHGRGWPTVFWNKHAPPHASVQYVVCIASPRATVNTEGGFVCRRCSCFYTLGSGADLKGVRYHKTLPNSSAPLALSGLLCTT